MLAKFTPLRAIVLGFISIAFAAAQLLPAGAAVQQPPGSRIKMDVPDTFEVSKLFSGFVVPIAGMSIVIVELPTTLGRFRARLAKHDRVDGLQVGRIGRQRQVDIVPVEHPVRWQSYLD